MADISSDQALNELKIKTDALPNDWYVTLVNPQTGEPAERMTVARFVELVTDKQPVATSESKGLMDKDFVYFNKIYTVDLEAGGEFEIPKSSMSYGLYYISLFSHGVSALYRLNHYQGSVLISGDSIFSGTFGEEGKVSVGIKTSGQNAFIVNKRSDTIYFILRTI